MIPHWIFSFANVGLFFFVGFLSQFQLKQTLKTFKGFFHQMGDFLKERMGWILMTF